MKSHAQHIEAHLCCPTNHAHSIDAWIRNIFTRDGKSLNIDDFDGCKHYWWHLRSNKGTCFFRHSGGSGIIVYGAILFEVKKALCVIADT